MTMLARFHHAARADSGFNPGSRLGRGAPLARAVLRCAVLFIRDNLDAKLTWESVAGAIDMDPFTFGRAFKLATGLTPHAYIVRCRLRRARRLLAAAELSIAEVALEVGCSCQSHLTTMFRTHVGTTPAAFRRAAKTARASFGAVAGLARRGSGAASPFQRGERLSGRMMPRGGGC